jgi:glycosyltransferase involved in cell wall biosynthesis
MIKLKKKVLKAKIAIVMPVFNEEKNIYKELNKWLVKFKFLNLEYFKFIVINDGSTDNTLVELKKFKSKKKIQIFNFRNSGHGNSCLKGYKIALKENFEWILQIDSDGQCDPRYLGDFLKLTKKNDCIFGHRVSRDDGIIRLLLSKIFSLVIFLKKGVYIKDMNVPYRLMHKNILRKNLSLIPKKITLKNAYLTFLINRNTKIKYVPINFLNRSFGKSNYNLSSMFLQLTNFIKNI